MKITVNYSGRSYGTGENSNSYQALIQKASTSVSLKFNFIETSYGRGWGDNVGVVHGASISLSHEDAQRLALGILNSLQGQKDVIHALYFGRDTTSTVATLKAKLSSDREPDNPFVLATCDGRTLQSGFLDLIGVPRHFSQANGEINARIWNRNNRGYDHVSVIPWRDHYTRMVDLLEAPSGTGA